MSVARGAFNGNGNDAKAASSSMLQFNLQVTKTQVIKELSTILPSSIKKFMQQPTFDKISSTCLLFFICTFQRKLIQQALDKARKQRLEGYDQTAVSLKIAELERDAENLKAQLSPLYSMILLRHSSYQHVNRDRLFFEGLYIVIINICDDALAGLEIRHDIEIQLGKLFRGRYFNLYDRMNAMPRSVDTLSLKELYAIKHETVNRALNGKLLSSLNARLQALNISGSAVNNSPLIYEFISSVITARALIKDPEFRKERMGVMNEDLNNSASLGRNATDASQTLAAAEDTATAPGKLQSGGSNTVVKAPATDAMTATAATVAEAAPAMDTLTNTVQTTVAAIAADGTKRFVGPGYENFGILYDDTLSDLEDLKAYLHTGRHPKLDMRKLRTRMSRAESGNTLSQRPSFAGSAAASSAAGSGNGELF